MTELICLWRGKQLPVREKKKKLAKADSIVTDPLSSYWCVRPSILFCSFVCVYVRVLTASALQMVLATWRQSVRSQVLLTVSSPASWKLNNKFSCSVGGRTTRANAFTHAERHEKSKRRESLTKIKKLLKKVEGPATWKMKNPEGN